MAVGSLGLPKGIPSNDAMSLYPEYESGPTGVTGRDATSISTSDPFVRWVNKEITRHEPAIMTWREKAKEAYRFKDGHQISDEDLAVLRRDKRPDTAINELQKFLKFASGIERRTPCALIYAPRSPEDQQAALKGELATKGYEWFCDRSEASFERSLVFEDKLTGGLGIADLGITRVNEPKGNPRYKRCDPFQFLWPETDAQNLSGVRWMGRETHMDVDEALRKWPDMAIYIRAASGGGANPDQFPDFGRGAHKPIDYVVPWIMTEPLNKNGGGSSGKPGKVPILEWQYYDDESGYYFFDPIQKDDTWLNEFDFHKLNRTYRTLYQQRITDYDKQDHRVYKRAFLLHRNILLADPAKLPTEVAARETGWGFTWNPMTGTWDREDKCFYGILKVFMSPQKYANAMFRQVLEIMGSSTKGGYLAETGAITVAQKRDIEDHGSRPGSTNIVQSGAISQNRIMPKPIPQIPAGSMQVLSFCIDIMEKISGLSMSLMGMDQSNTPGVTLRKRLTSGMVLLAAEFDSLTRFRKREGYLAFDFLKLMADDRWIRIGGPFDSQAVAQLKKDPFALDYDVVLDENDQDPTLRQYYTDSILSIAPMLVRTGNFFPDLLDYVNLPVQIRQKLKEGMQKSEQSKMQAAQQGLSVGGRGKPRSLAEIKGSEQLIQARAMKDVAQAQALRHGSQRDDMGMRLDAIRSIFDAQLAHRKEQREKQQGDRALSLDALDKLFKGIAGFQRGSEA